MLAEQGQTTPAPVTDITVMSDQPEVVIEARDIRKSYGHIHALSGASLTIRAGEVLALLGDNGAGKSTLTKVICGALTPDSGELFFRGQPISVQSVRHAQELGVEAVYQDLAQAPDLAVADNMFLGRERYKPGLRGAFGVLDREAMAEAASSVLVDLGVTVPARSVPVRDLSGGQRQAIAVGRAAMWATSAIVMDEPTAALGPKQTALVYDTIRAGAARGLAIVVVSHDIPHMLTLANRIAVMRHGAVVANVAAADVTLTDVIATMLGDKEAIA